MLSGLLLAVIFQVAAEGDPVALVQMLVSAIQSKNWAVVVAGIVMLITMTLNRFIFPRLNIDKKWAPLASAIVGTLFSGGAALAGAVVGLPLVEVLTMLISGLVSGATATGLWELAGKHVFAKKDAAVDQVSPPQG